MAHGVCLLLIRYQPHVRRLYCRPFQTLVFRTTKTIMADFNKFDPRVDSLVIETKTFWDSAIGKLADADMHWLADAVHRHPEKASNVQYERAHTGFTRTITVTVADIERLYDEKMSG